MNFKNKKIYTYISMFLIFLISIFLFKEKLINKFFPKQDKPATEEIFDERVNVSVTSAVSMPIPENIKCSGVAKRDSIKFVADNSREISFIVGNNITEVKQGELLFSYKHDDLVARKERLENDLKLKTEILERNTKLDVHSVISKDELNKIQIEASNSRGELNEIKCKIADSIKKAPFDCYVKHHGLINGSFVAHGNDVLTIFKKGKMIIEVNLNLKEVNSLEESNLLNKHAKLYFSNKRKVKGKVIYFLNNADPFTASVPAIIEIEDPDNKITSGEVCDVKISTGVIKRKFILPEEALCGEEYDYHVFIIKKNIAYKVSVVKHSQKDGNVVISGIADKDVVVISGAHRLSNLSKVRI